MVFVIVFVFVFHNLNLKKKIFFVFFFLFSLLMCFLIHRVAVVNQYYEAEVVSEYVIKGNTAVLKCTIPSFVADFVKVEAWLASDGTEYLPTQEFG